MHRLLELIFGLQKGFLSREGELSLEFSPQWPGQQYIGAGLWNFVLIALAIWLVIHVYRREGRSRNVKITLGVLRAAILLFIIAMLNRPVLSLVQSRTEPSVLAVLVDESISMRVKDAGTKDHPLGRLEAVEQVLADGDKALLKSLAKTHEIRLYRFDQTAQPIGSVHQTKPNESSTNDDSHSAIAALKGLKPEGQETRVVHSVREVLDNLQGQRIAGVVVLTDGRENPAESLADALGAVKDLGAKVYPIAVGSDQSPRNIEVQNVNVQENAFKGDIVNVKATIRATGYEPNHPVKLVLKDKRTGQLLHGSDRSPVEQSITIADDKPTEVELQFKPEEIGTVDVQVEAEKQAGELDDEDNIRVAQVSVLDAKLAVLYVEGYPRWEYRYIKNEMIRDDTVDISCLLTSADPTFAQEGDRPIKRFPESIQELLDYDVVLFGDVDPRQFTDNQLQLVSEFVSKKGGGFGMIAGPKWSPQSYRNTAIEPILPVSIARVEGGDPPSITQGFRPVLTREGTASGIFRFFADRTQNEKYLKEDWQPVFWYCQGVTTKQGVGEVYAEHPTDTGPDGRKAPILVMGRFGAGRTMFSAIDDSWRWRFYTGESVFDNYWVQQLRNLARSKKLGQRRITITSLRPNYELGGQVRVSMRVLDPTLLQQLPDQIRVDITDSAGQTIRQETLMRQEGQNDLYVASWTADRIGKFLVKLPPIASGVESLQTPVEVSVPRLELAQPQIDRTLLTRLASETLGQTVNLNEAADKLPAMIPSAAKIIPIQTDQPLWNAPLAMLLFVMLIAAEWIIRKAFGML